MKKVPSEEELGKDNWSRLRLIELSLTRDACLTFEGKLISLELFLNNQMWEDVDYQKQSTWQLCRDITKLREHVNRMFHDYERESNEQEKRICKSEGQCLEEIIN